MAYLLAADDEAAFAVVCNDGKVVNGITAATFKYAAPSAIDNAETHKSDLLQGVVDGKMRLVCAEGIAISVYDGAGRLLNKTTIDVSSLPTGVYFIKAGAAEAVKFLKR